MPWMTACSEHDSNLGEVCYADLFSMLESWTKIFKDLQFVQEVHLPIGRVGLDSQKLAKETGLTLRRCLDLIDRFVQSLLAEMQITDSRQGIVEAESVSKLTALAFVSIPLSFVAGLFSTQVHEPKAAYAVHLSLRGANLIEYKAKVMSNLRAESRLLHKERIQTHVFIARVSSTLYVAIFKRTRETVVVLTPFVIILAAIAALLSPIVVLWLRGIDRGFSVVITVLLLPLNIALLGPLMAGTSSPGPIRLDMKKLLRAIRQDREKHRKRRAKEKKRRRQDAGLNPEAPGDESTDDDEPPTQRN
ncbi:hypothetical protein ST47_g9883 [Ascochyta rabiei]|uniref:Uncharacterized protein n=1 Tax=Didymella rabiei TaxID=5454 RepID=A0A162WDP5_DIDRA|nr:hypothetical protein ST47_g9883 [Ascochyta rabiei]